MAWLHSLGGWKCNGLMAIISPTTAVTNAGDRFRVLSRICLNRELVPHPIVAMTIFEANDESARFSACT